MEITTIGIGDDGDIKCMGTMTSFVTTFRYCSQIWSLFVADCTNISNLTYNWPVALTGDAGRVG